MKFTEKPCVQTSYLLKFGTLTTEYGNELNRSDGMNADKTIWRDYMLMLGVCWMKQHREDTMKELGANIWENRV